MALVTENANLVRQKVKIALASAHPAIQEQFKDLLAYLATQGKNPDLQFIPFSEAQSIIDTGTDLVGAACTLYGLYATTAPTRVSTTSAFFAIHDAATNGATTTTIVTARVKALGQVYNVTAPKGIALVTGLTVSSATAVGGATESTTPDGVQGFVIVGA